MTSCIRPCAELVISCQLFADGQPLGLPVSTSAHSAKAGSMKWNEWLTLPARYSDLTADASIAFTIYDILSPHHTVVVGGLRFRCSTPNGSSQLFLFGHFGFVCLLFLSHFVFYFLIHTNSKLRKGRKKLLVWPGGGRRPRRGYHTGTHRRHRRLTTHRTRMCECLFVLCCVVSALFHLLFGSCSACVIAQMSSSMCVY